MSFSGIILNLLVVVGAGAAGIEYGRRHPTNAWSRLVHGIRDWLVNLGEDKNENPPPPPTATAEEPTPPRV